MAICAQTSWASLLSLLVILVAVVFQVFFNEDADIFQRARRAPVGCRDIAYAMGENTFIELGLTQSQWGWEVG